MSRCKWNSHSATNGCRHIRHRRFQGKMLAQIQEDQIRYIILHVIVFYSAPHWERDRNDFMSLTLVFSFLLTSLNFRSLLCWSWNNRALVQSSWSLSIWPSLGQMWPQSSELRYLPWCASQVPLEPPGQAHSLWTIVLLNLDSVCQICFYTHLTQTDLRVCAHTHPQHTHNTYRHTTHIHIVILGMPRM